jgi:transcription antitermination factor NusG
MLLCEHNRVTDAAVGRPLLNPIRPRLAGAGPAQCSRAAPDVPQWYALRLRSNREFQVRAALEGLSIETFLPTWSEDVRWSDRLKRTERVLFPGYVFVRIIEWSQVYAALCTRGVVQLLPNSFKPTPIDEREIENVRLVMASRLASTPCEFAAGELVTIDSGPLAGVSGVVKKTKGALRVVVSVEILRRSVAIELDADTLLKTPLKGPVAA